MKQQAGTTDHHGFYVSGDIAAQDLNSALTNIALPVYRPASVSSKPKKKLISGRQTGLGAISEATF